MQSIETNAEQKIFDHLFILPVFNEAIILRKSVESLLQFLENNWKRNSLWSVVIADNASTDDTKRIGSALMAEHPKQVCYVRIDKKGRGNALREIIRSFDSSYYLYSDIDIPVDFSEFLNFFSLLEGNELDIVIGKRKGRRPFARKVLTYGLRLWTRSVFQLSFADPQSGFKAFNAKAADLALLCREESYFFDTELLVHGARENLRMKEVEILWIEQRYKTRPSKVTFFKDSYKGISAMIRIFRRLNK